MEKIFAHVAFNNPLIYGTFKTKNHVFSITSALLYVCKIKEIKNHINRIAKKLAGKRGYNYEKNYCVQRGD